MQEQLINRSVAIPASVISSSEIKEGPFLQQPGYPAEHVEPALKNSILSEFQHDKYSVMKAAPSSQLFFYQTLAMFLFIYGVSCYTSVAEFNAQVQVSCLFAICISGYLCGANINPSVTLSNCLRKENRYTKKMLLLYVAAQVLGTILALCLAELLNGIQFPILVPNDTSIMSLFQIFLSQATGTFVLVFFVLEVSNPNTTFIENQLSGFVSIVVFVHLGRIYAVSSKSIINIALTLSLALMAGTRGEWEGIKWCWLWFLGDVVGAVVATVFYDQIFEPTIRYIREKRRQSELFGSQFASRESAQLLN